MYTNSKLAKSVRLAIAFGAASASALTANVAVAQEEEDVEKIAVTGSRIQRANMVSSSPVTEISAEDIAISGITRMEDLLNDMPAIFAAQTANLANGSTGTATVDLRNLGPERTLVLINGRRMPPGSPVAGGIGSDINQIPAGMVERVEVLTGGASATYGSDAIGGVVNFIMKDDFEGFEFDFQYSFYQHDNDNSRIQEINAASGYDAPTGNVTDGHTRDFSLMMGSNTADGRGNVTMFATYRNIDPILQGSRDYSNCALGGGSPENFSCVGSTTLPEGRITDFGLADSSFDFIVQGDQFVDRDGLTYNYAPGNHFQRPDQRYTLGAFGHYEINEHADVYAETMFMDDRNFAQIAPSGAFFVTSQLFCGNPLLSQQQFDAVCGANGLTENDFVTAFIGRRNVEGANRSDDLRHTAYRGVVGVRGIINDSWSYDVFGNFSRVVFSQVYQNDLSTTRIARAFDVVEGPDGTPTCRSALPDPVTGAAAVDPACVPWNIFETGGVTQAALNYVSLPLFSTGENTSLQISGFVTGDLTDMGVIVPGTSTGVNVVLGLERRTEKLVFRPDQGFQSGDGAGQGGTTAAVQGEFSVEEIFGEVLIPVLEGHDFAEQVNIELAYRYSDYSTDKTTDTYKVGLDWNINDDVRVRTSFQRAVRAGNVRELFRPLSSGLFNMNDDPCADGTFTVEQCARTGLDPSLYGSDSLTNPAGQYNQVTGGNSELDPEKSDTFAFGVVLAPSAIPNFTVTLDWFNIEIEDAIAGVPSAEILRLCGVDNNEEACGLINRGPAGDLWIGPSSNIVSRDINLGFFETSGVDFDISYDFGIADYGEIKTSFIGTYLTKWDQENVPGSGVQDCAGGWDRGTCGTPVPEFRFNLRAAWVTPWDATITGTVRFIDEVNEAVFATGNVRTDGPTTLDSQAYLDLAATWNVLDSTQLRFGINNVLDEEPPLLPSAPSGSSNGNTFVAYDVLGRYIFAGVNVSF